MRGLLERLGHDHRDVLAPVVDHVVLQREVLRAPAAALLRVLHRNERLGEARRGVVRDDGVHEPG